VVGGPYAGSQTTTVSADVVIGGWWGGVAEESAAAPSTDAAAVAPRFGAQGQFILTTATSASVGGSAYSKSTASSWDAGLSPAFDYFFVDHVSLGLDASVDFGGASSLDASGTQTTSSSKSFGMAPRLGVELALAPSVSLWPMVEIGYGVGSVNQTSVAGSNQHTYSRTWVDASARLLLHATSHLFIGAGPFVFHELSDTDQNNYENDATNVGASFILGGWL
jgi:hypothetical protein